MDKTDKADETASANTPMKTDTPKAADPTDHADNKALWGGRFEEGIADAMQTYGASLPVDKRMWRQDIAGSKAHAHMLAAQGVITQDDANAICDGLDAIARDIQAGDFDFNIADEDIHMSIESELTRRIGDAGKRLHTGRSRNDQVATDMRLWCKDASRKLAHDVCGLRDALITLARANIDVIMPGYTHMQKAQPVLFAHHMLAWEAMLARDFGRFKISALAADTLPLGSAALAGTTYPLDRQAVARELGFQHVSANSLDAVSDRDFICDFIYAASVCMMHLSRMCEEIILWSTDEFKFIELSDEYSTGSSIMPQKKNPDFAELTRGKTGRVYGDLMGILTVLKGLPLAYDKDLQEDKEGAFDAFDTLVLAIEALRGMTSTMRVNADAMRKGAEGGFMAATDMADYLVGRGMAFRDAHAVVGHIVLECEKQGRTLQDLSTDELKAFDAAFDDDAKDAIAIDNVVARRTTYGGTAPTRVSEQLQDATARLTQDTESV
jgi:argininosuccinate lyase